MIIAGRFDFFLRCIVLSCKLRLSCGSYKILFCLVPVREVPVPDCSTFATIHNLSHVSIHTQVRCSLLLAHWCSLAKRMRYIYCCCCACAARSGRRRRQQQETTTGFGRRVENRHKSHNFDDSQIILLDLLSDPRIVSSFSLFLVYSGLVLPLSPLLCVLGSPSPSPPQTDTHTGRRRRYAMAGVDTPTQRLRLRGGL